MYNLDSGEILLNNVNANNYSLKSWRKMFSVVTQENSIISGTIKDNLIFGIDREITESELNEALKKVNLLDEFNNLPFKLETVVGDQGVMLSGGQRQRLQIAQAYLKKSKVLILDEVTSNLDADSEKIISNLINTIAESKNVIIIAHRLSTIVDSDCIYFLNNHKIEASGTHKELLKKLPKYKKFVNEQVITIN